MAKYFKSGSDAVAIVGRNADTFTSPALIGSLDDQIKASLNALINKPDRLANLLVNKADKFTSIFKKMDTAGDFKSFYRGMTDEGKQLFRSKITDSDLLKKMDEADGITDATRQLERSEDAVRRSEAAARRSETFAKRAEDVDLTMPDGSKKKVKYGSEEFWKSIRLGAMVGAGYGLLMWIDDKFKDREEEYKNCMAGCLPHNWDEYEYGNLEKSDLQFSTPETLKEYQITPIDGQPYCKAEMDDCGEFCDQRCEEESEDVRIPLIDPLRDVTREGAEGLGDILNALFGGLFEGMGLDTGMVGYASSASASMIMMIMVIMLLK
jgi:hypothetical protein